jgi:hypothetical protein
MVYLEDQPPPEINKVDLSKKSSSRQVTEFSSKKPSTKKESSMIVA